MREIMLSRRPGYNCRRALSIHSFLLAVCSSLFVSGCVQEKKETPTTGHLFVLVPQSPSPVLVGEIDEFLRLYGEHGAHISYRVTSSEMAIDDFVKDSMKLIFSTRRLSESERRSVEKKWGSPVEIVVAYDAVALVVSKRNPVAEISTRELEGVITGKIEGWDQLARRNGARGKINLVVQNSSDELAFLHGASPKEIFKPARLTLPPTPTECLALVARDPLALGVVGLGWLDSARSKIKTLKVGQLAVEDSAFGAVPVQAIGSYFTPHPAYIYQKFYPLRRAIYLYNRSEGFDLAAGFTTFVATREGQQIFLQRGFVPGTQPIRLRPSAP